MPPFSAEDRFRPPVTRRPYVLAIAAVVVLLLVGGSAWYFLAGGSDQGQVSVTPSTNPTASEASDPDVTDQVTASAEPTETDEDAATGSLLQYVTAQAPSTSANGVDNSNNVTTYVASNLLDGNPATAWRMDGSAAGTTLTFMFDTDRTVDHVGLINGLAKVDPVRNEDRYPENRRVLKVTWVVGSFSVGQTLVDGDTSMQEISFPPVMTSTIQLQIDDVSGRATGTKDRTAISDVLIAND